MFGGLVELVKFACRKRRSRREGESLTQDEIDLIEQSMDGRGRAKCPDCGGRLLQGPTHGDDFNAACDRCGSEFNLMLAFGELMLGQRISDRGPRKLGERACLYGKR